MTPYLFIHSLFFSELSNKEHVDTIACKGHPGGVLEHCDKVTFDI